MTKDNINPSHYKQHPSGVECITITEHFSFCLGNAIKYIWRAEYKNGLEDLKKAQWYIAREIKRREEAEAKEAATREQRCLRVGCNGVYSRAHGKCITCNIAWSDVTLDGTSVPPGPAYDELRAVFGEKRTPDPDRRWPSRD